MIFELHYEPSNDFGSGVIELRDEIYVDDLLLANQAAQLHGRGEFYVTLVTRLAGADEPILEYLAPGDYVRLRNAVDTIWTDAMGSDHDLTGRKPNGGVRARVQVWKACQWKGCSERFASPVASALRCGYHCSNGERDARQLRVQPDLSDYRHD